MMDDVFSGLDNKTARTVFRRVFGPSGLLRSNTTVLLATNNTKFLPAANHITMLDNGRIVRNQVAYSEFPPSEWGLDNDDEEDSGESIVDEPSNDDEDNRNSPPEAVKQRVELLAALEAKKVQMDLTRQTGDIDCYKIYIKSMGIHNAVGYTILAILGVSSCFIPRKIVPDFPYDFFHLLQHNNFLTVLRIVTFRDYSSIVDTERCQPDRLWLDGGICHSWPQCNGTGYFRLCVS